MNVVDIMTEKPVIISINRTLSQALTTMYKTGCHHLPVVGRDGHLIGVISDRDCRMALNSPHTKRDDWRDDKLANELLVRSVMTPAPIVVEPNTAADEAARLMLVNHVGCLPVMRAETLVGIITKSDILMAFMNMHEVIKKLTDGQSAT